MQQDCKASIACVGCNSCMPLPKTSLPIMVGKALASTDVLQATRSHTAHRPQQFISCCSRGSRPARCIATPQASDMQLDTQASIPQHWQQALDKESAGRRRYLMKYMRQLQDINALESSIVTLSDEQLADKTDEFRMRLAAGATLDDLLVEAFAVVREVSKRVLGMRPYDVQMIGAMALHEGHIAEMQTGEGKTLVAAIAAYLNALPGQGVHILTVNDYLANRDANWVGKIHRFLKLSVGWIRGTNKLKDRAERQRDQEQFTMDITYTTAMELGFTVLQDMNAQVPDQLVHIRPPNFAIVDEADYILIDEANQPLIISQSISSHTLQVKQATIKCILANKVVDRLLREEIITSRGNDQLPDGTQPGQIMRTQEDPVHSRVMVEANRVRFYKPWQASNGVQHHYYYSMMRQEKWASFSDQGLRRVRALLEQELAQHNKCSDVPLPPLQGGSDSLWAGNLPWGSVLLSALKAHKVYERDVDYLVDADPRDPERKKIFIISTATGRRLDNSKWELHQAVEAKEDIIPQPPTVVTASVTMAVFLSKYRKVAGMTGTASTEEAELQELYNLSVVPIPTHLPIRRIDYPLQMFLTPGEKELAILSAVQTAHSMGRPVLLGTNSVRESEFYYSLLLNWAAKYRQVMLQPAPRIMLLNAMPARVAAEAQIIALAGLPGAITISTSMAGRGTDILLGGNPKNLTQVALEDMLYQELSGVPRFSSTPYIGKEADDHAVLEMYAMYKDVFQDLLAKLQHEPLFRTEREGAIAAAEQYITLSRKRNIKEADQIMQEVVEGCEELRAKYVRWVSPWRPDRQTDGQMGTDPNVSQLQTLQSVQAFLREHSNDRLSVKDATYESDTDIEDSMGPEGPSGALQGPPGAPLVGTDVAASLPPSLQPLAWLIEAQGAQGAPGEAQQPPELTHAQKAELRKYLVERLRRVALYLWTQFDLWCAKKAQDVRAVDGLLVIATSIMDHARLERQLRGRAGRQGDRGETLAMFDLVDPMLEVVQQGMQTKGLGIEQMGSLGGVTGPISDLVASQARQRWQQSARDFRRRSQILDKIDDTFRQHIDSKRRVILCGTHQQRSELVNMYIKEVVDTMCRKHVRPHASPATWNLAALFDELEAIVNPATDDEKVAELLDQRDNRSIMAAPITLALFHPPYAPSAKPYPSLNLNPTALELLHEILQLRHIDVADVEQSGGPVQWLKGKVAGKGAPRAPLRTVEGELQRVLQPLLQIDGRAHSELQAVMAEALGIRNLETLPLEATPVRVQYNLMRMRQRMLGDEELDLLPYEGRWGRAATVLRDQLAVMCVMALHLKMFALERVQYRISDGLQSMEYIQEDFKQWERLELLATLDSSTERFLETLQDLKSGVTVRTFVHFDATVEYNLDVTMLFDDVLHTFREEAVRQLFIGPVRDNFVAMLSSMPHIFPINNGKPMSLGTGASAPSITAPAEQPVAASLQKPTAVVAGDGSMASATQNGANGARGAPAAVAAAAAAVAVQSDGIGDVEEVVNGVADVDVASSVGVWEDMIEQIVDDVDLPDL